jgi:uncharacterized membrane protein
MRAVRPKWESPAWVFRSFWRWSKTDRFALPLLVSIAAYIVYWSEISIERFYALHAAVADLGYNMELLWNQTQVGVPSLTQYLEYVAYYPVATILSPLSLADSYPLLLFVQSAALGLAALPLYLIAKDKLKLGPAAYLISAAYLLYFPLAGLNWFDFHIEAFFIPLFLTGYFLITRGRIRLGAALILLSGGTTYPYMILVVLFSVICVGEFLVQRYLLQRVVSSEGLRVFILLAISSASILAYQHWLFNANLHGGSLSVPVNNRLEVLALVFVPLGLFPLGSWRWSLMVLPFAALILTNPCNCYSFPPIFTEQYSALFIPFVFLGTIDTIRFLGEKISKLSVGEHVRVRAIPRRLHRPDQRLISLTLTSGVVLTVLLYASIFEPYGPYNDYTPDAFNLASQTRINWTIYDDLEQLAHVVPKTTPYVLFQNDMPELLPRPLAYDNTPLTTGFDSWENATLTDASSGYFPLIQPYGPPVEARILYSVGNPWSPDFPYSPVPGISMYNFTRVLYDSGDYGVLGEVDGMLALERGYDANPEAYAPYSATFPAQSMLNATSKIPGVAGTPTITGINLSNWTKLFYGPYTFLSPGWYRVSFSLRVTNDSPSNVIALYVDANNGKLIVGSNYAHYITGENFTGTNTWDNINWTFYCNDSYQRVEFVGIVGNWVGSLSLRSVQLTQLAPGSPMFDSDDAED